MWPINRPLPKDPDYDTTIDPKWNDVPKDDLQRPGCVRRVNHSREGIETDTALYHVTDYERMKVVCVGEDCHVRLFDFDTQEVEVVIKNNDYQQPHLVNVNHQMFYCLDADLLPGKAVIGTKDSKLKLGDLETGKLVGTFPSHDAWVTDVKANFEDNLVFSGSADYTLGLTDLRARKVVRRIRLPSNADVVHRIAVDFDMMLGMAFTNSYIFRLFDLADGREINRYETDHLGEDRKDSKRGYGILSGCVNWETMECITGGAEGLIQQWNLQTGANMKTIDMRDHSWWSFDPENEVQPLSPSVYTMDANWDEGWLMTCTTQNYMHLWDLKTWTKTHHFRRGQGNRAFMDNGWQNWDWTCGPCRWVQRVTVQGGADCRRHRRV